MTKKGYDQITYGGTTQAATGSIVDTNATVTFSIAGGNWGDGDDALPANMHEIERLLGHKIRLSSRSDSKLVMIARAEGGAVRPVQSAGSHHLGDAASRTRTHAQDMAKESD